jgi:hypothetical protein
MRIKEERSGEEERGGDEDKRGRERRLQLRRNINEGKGSSAES